MSPNASLPTLAYPSFVTLARELSASVDFVGGKHCGINLEGIEGRFIAAMLPPFSLPKMTKECY